MSWLTRAFQREGPWMTRRPTPPEGLVLRELFSMGRGHHRLEMDKYPWARWILIDLTAGKRGDSIHGERAAPGTRQFWVRRVEGMPRVLSVDLYSGYAHAIVELHGEPA